jgi:hypothetical protein
MNLKSKGLLIRFSRKVGFQILMLYSQQRMKKSHRALESESSSAPFLFIKTQFSSGTKKSGT